VRLRNLTNVQDVEEPAFAGIDVRGGMMGNAPVALTGRIDRNEAAPTRTWISPSKAHASSM
jgi:hypothetical protein